MFVHTFKARRVDAVVSVKVLLGRLTCGCTWHRSLGGGFCFNIILILLGRLQLKSYLPYVVSIVSFCQVC